MHRGCLGFLRIRRRVTIHAVVLALVLPLVLGLLPQLAMAADNSLDRDVAASICGPSNPGGPADGTIHHSGHGDCILCASCAATGVVPAGSTAAFGAEPRRVEAVPAVPPAGLPQPLRALLDASPPRGPPAAAFHA
jgi:hypothetical protein